jgi:hypothetical protein
MLQAFIDESYEPNGRFVLAGYISDSKSWAEFSIEWQALLKPYGVLNEHQEYHFKYSEMASTPERAARIPAFEAVARKHALLAVSCTLNIPDLRSAIDRISAPGVVMDFGPLKNPYRVGFRALMDKFHNHRKAFAEILNPDEPVHFVFDEQLGAQAGIIAEWSEYLSSRSAEVRKVYGSTPLFRRDRDVLPLQAADLWAGKVREELAKGEAASLFVAERENSRHQFPCLHMDWDEEALVKDLVNAIRSQYAGPVYDSRISFLPWTQIS